MNAHDVKNADVCADGCDSDVQNVAVSLGYALNFGKGEDSEIVKYNTSMSREEYECFLKHRPEVDFEKEMLRFNDIARVLPKWADRVFNDIVDRETVKFRKDSFYEIWGFTKEEIDAPDWKITSIAEVLISVYEVGNFMNQ